MIKKVLGLLFVVTLSLIAVPGVSAADFTVTCSTSSCTPNPLSSFYSSSIVWYPGLSVTKTLHINNNSNQPVKTIAQNTSTTGDINQVIQFDIVRTSDSVSIWSGSLYSFYNAGVQTLLSSGTTAGDFSFTAQMYPTANNSYQGKQTKFDLEFGFEIPTPTPSVCTVTKPPAPGGLSLSQQSNTDVKVTWSSVSDPVTGYYISWGTNTGADNTGTKSIGKTTEATVSGLTLDSKRYYFKIRAVNGCKEGEFSGLSNIGTGPDLFATMNPTSTPTPVVGGTVAGASTTATPSVQQPTNNNQQSTNEETNSETNVLGISTSKQCKNCKWWPFLLLELLGIVVFLWIMGTGMSLLKSFLVGSIIPFLTHGTFVLINRTCIEDLSHLLFLNATSLICRYFVLFALLLYAVLWGVFQTLFKQKNEQEI